MRTAYLDNNASSPLLPEILAAMQPFFVEAHGNPSSLHGRGQQARVALETARGSVAKLLGAAPSEILFTSGGTESDNFALFGLVTPGDHVITTAVEHHAVLHPCRRLEAQGATVTVLPVDRDGRVDPSAVRRALRPKTRLISVMAANNETGVLQPVEEVGRIAAEADVWFHTDAVQAVGRVPLDVNRMKCDLLTLSAHKMNGPQGVGALYLRGGGQERGHRAGTENLAGIVGLGAACQVVQAWLARHGELDLAALRDRLEGGILEAVVGTQVNGRGAPRVPNTTNIAFDRVPGKGLVVALDRLGVYASTGAACATTTNEPPHVLLAMGLPPELAHASVRFSLGEQTTPQEIDLALEIIPRAVAAVRADSPLWAEPAVG